MSDPIVIKQLSDVASAVGGRLVGADARFQGVSTDSRTLTRGALFVALSGPNFDGNQFLPMAESRGAVAAVVSEQQSSPLPQIIVEDTLIALGQLAAAWRNQFDIPLLAITGSNGKTTVKEMVAEILRTEGEGTVTAGNLNNEIGVPLTLLRMKSADRWAVVEMGASAVGEIEGLCKIATPTASLVNNAGAAHLGGFGSEQKIVEAKGEIYAALPTSAVAVMNQTLPQFAYWHALVGDRKQFCFGTHPAGQRPEAALSGVVELDHPFELVYQKSSVEVDLPLPGEHNRLNAIAAAALSLQAGATLEQIKQGLERVSSVKGRLHYLAGLAGVTLIDDSYNASPESMRSAIAVLAAEPGERVLVVGDMGELGDDAAALHRTVGQTAAEAGIEQLYAAGEHAAAVVEGYGSAGKSFGSVVALIEQLLPVVENKMTILVKGSRFMKMERVIEALSLDQREQMQAEHTHT